MKVIFIKSVSVNGGQISGPSFVYANVYDLPDDTANDYIKKWAIPLEGWETNPKRPIAIFYPK